MPDEKLHLVLTASGIESRKSKTYLFATVHVINPNNEDRFLGQTEVIENSLNPRWIRTFHLSYRFGRKINFKVTLYDGQKLDAKSRHEEQRKDQHLKCLMLGENQFEVNHILGQRGNTVTKELKEGAGFITVSLEKPSILKENESLRFQFRGLTLYNRKKQHKFWNSVCNAYFVIMRSRVLPNGSQWHPVYKSEVILNHLHPVWRINEIGLYILCKNNLRGGIKVDVFDLKSNGKEIKIGSFETNVEYLLASKSARGNADVSKAFTLLSDDGNEVGKIIVMEAKIQKTTMKSLGLQNYHTPSFYDYLFQGCTIKLSIAIDFSSSNGDFSSPNSPHFFSEEQDPPRMNDYQKVFCYLGTILENYNSEQNFSIWGFGTVEGDVSERFFLCGPQNEIQGVEGVDGIIEVYLDTLHNKDTRRDNKSLDEVINVATNFEGRNKEDGLNYSILVILTAGKISKVPEIMSTLSNTRSKPLSVVIVGIGDGHFDDARALANDYVKFLEFNSHTDNENSLIESILERVPDQIVNYFWNQGILLNANSI